MTALSKFLLLLAIFLSEGYANAFLILSKVARNQVQVNYLSRLKGTNKPKSINLNGQPANQRLEWDAELPNILSSKQGKYSLLQKQDAELPSKITDSTTQFTSNTSHKFEAVNGINTSYTFDAVNGVNVKPFEAVNGINTSYTFEAVNGVNANLYEAVNGINTSYTFEAVNGVNAKLFEAVNGMINAHNKYSDQSSDVQRRVR